MTFSANQKKELEAPLNRANVKTRSQSGRSLSYIEGWKAIEEANRIFDFDGWTRETIEIKCVAERDRKLSSGADGHGVSYIARVRIIACGISREGVGAGHGIDRDLGQAHESAIKEAETDAMKRALMTFGNPFGLALYDKEQVNVQDEPKAKKNDETKKIFSEMEKQIRECSTIDLLKGWSASHKKDIATLPLDWQENLRTEYGDKLAELQG